MSLAREHVELLQQALVLLDAPAEVTSCAVERAASPQDGLMSSVWRVLVPGSSPLILKVAHGDQEERLAFNTALLYRNELNIYQLILPALAELGSPPSVPRCLVASCDGAQEALVLEDLGAQGYRMATRMEGLDGAHARLVMEELAKFHALSLAMRERQPQRFLELTRLVKEALYCEEMREGWALVTARTFQHTALMIDQVLPARYGAALRNTLSGGFDFLVNMVQGSEPWGVINHGDCWTNNLMFRYSKTSSPEEVRLLDFQLARYSSLGLDVMFFLCTSVQPAVLSAELDVLLQTYVQRLASCLGETPLVQEEEVLAEVHRCAGYGLAKAFVCLPLFTRPPGPSPRGGGDVMGDVEELTLDCTAHCRAWLAGTVRLLVDRGLIT